MKKNSRKRGTHRHTKTPKCEEDTKQKLHVTETTKKDAHIHTNTHSGKKENRQSRAAQSPEQNHATNETHVVHRRVYKRQETCREVHSDKHTHVQKYPINSARCTMKQKRRYSHGEARDTRAHRCACSGRVARRLGRSQRPPRRRNLRF